MSAKGKSFIAKPPAELKGVSSEVLKARTPTGLTKARKLRDKYLSGEEPRKAKREIRMKTYLASQKYLQTKPKEATLLPQLTGLSLSTAVYLLVSL